MKKILTIALILVLSMGAYAQTEHMTFVGIPLNGTIDQFQQKLIAKGFTHNKQMSSALEIGMRAFNGAFIGEKANITIYYDSKTKLVYSAKAFFDMLNEKKSQEKYDYLKSLIFEKYHPSKDDLEIEVENGLETIWIYTKLGFICIWQRKEEASMDYPNIYSVHIQYNDFKNLEKHENSKLDDL